MANPTPLASIFNPVIVQYFNYDEYSFDAEFPYDIAYFGGEFRQSIGPFPRHEPNGGLVLHLNNDGSVTSTLDVVKYTRPRLPSGGYADYWETNPILMEMFPDEYIYQQLGSEEEVEQAVEATGENWIQIDFTPYFPIQIEAYVVEPELPAR